MGVRPDESDEYMHELGPDPNFKENMHINRFHPRNGWVAGREPVTSGYLRSDDRARRRRIRRHQLPHHDR